MGQPWLLLATICPNVAGGLSHLSHDQCWNQWRKVVLEIAHFPKTLWFHSHGPCDKSKSAYVLRNHIIPNSSMVGTPGTTRPVALWFQDANVFVGNDAISQQEWVLALMHCCHRPRLVRRLDLSPLRLDDMHALSSGERQETVFLYVWTVRKSKMNPLVAMYLHHFKAGVSIHLLQWSDYTRCLSCMSQNHAMNTTIMRYNKQ